MNLNKIKKQWKGKALAEVWQDIRHFNIKIDLSLPAKVYVVDQYRYRHESEEEAMRGDWEKIGADFRVSIEKAEREAAVK